MCAGLVQAWGSLCLIAVPNRNMFLTLGFLSAQFCWTLFFIWINQAWKGMKSLWDSPVMSDAGIRSGCCAADCTFSLALRGARDTETEASWASQGCRVTAFPLLTSLKPSHVSCVAHSLLRSVPGPGSSWFLSHQKGRSGCMDLKPFEWQRRKMEERSYGRLAGKQLH